MPSKYEYKVVKPAAMNRNMGWGFIEKLQDQINQEAENGWDFYRDLDSPALVFRRLRQGAPRDVD